LPRAAALRRWFSRKVSADRVKTVSGAGRDTDATGEDGGPVKPFVEHLEDLRRTLFKILGALFVGFNIALVCANHILAFLKAPLRRVTDHPEHFLQNIDVTGSFSLWMQLALYVGAILSAPVIFYFIGQFVLPALRPREKQVLWPSFLVGAGLFLLGAAACYYLMIPQTLRAFIQLSHWLEIEPRWTVESYIGFVTQFMLVCGLTFEIPLVVVILVQVGLLGYDTVRRGRKIFIAVSFAVSAFLAPPDVLSMILMAIPLVILFEIAIWLSWLTERRRAKARRG
jgi:sec-independent protein translocase protein TatC